MSTNKLLRIDFGGVDYYFAEQTVVVDGKQWEGRILPESSNVVIKTGGFQAYEAGQPLVVLNNNDGFFDSIMLDDDTKYIGGNEAEYYFNTTSLKKYYILDGYISGSKFFITLTDQFENLLDTPVWNRRITENTYPNAAETAYDKVINYIAGELPKPNKVKNYGKYMLRCEYVNNSATNKYLVGKFALAPGLTLDLAYDPNGTDITGSCTLTLSGEYYYINYTTGTQPDYITINFSFGTTITSEQLLTGIFGLFSNPVDLSKIKGSGYDYFLHQVMNYNDENQNARWSYIINDSTGGQQILEEVCKSFNLDFFVDKTNSIVLYLPDFYFSTFAQVLYPPVPPIEFQTVIDSYGNKITPEILSYDGRRPDTYYLKNQIEYKDFYDVGDDSYRRIRLLNNYDSINNWNGIIHNLKEEYKCFGIKSSPSAFTTAKNRLIISLEPLKRFYITMSYQTLVDKGIGLNSILKFYHQDDFSGEERHYIVKAIEFDEPVTLELYDIEHLFHLDKYQQFKLNSNDIQGSKVINDLSTMGHYEVNNFGVFHDTAVVFNGISSYRFDGSSYMTCGIDGVATLQKNFHFMFETEFNVRFKLQFDATGSQEYIYHQYQDANNYIQIFKRAVDRVRFQVVIGGVSVVSIQSSVLSALTKYDINIVRDSSGNIGLYEDGNLVSYVNYTGKHIIPNHIEIGRFNDGVTPGSYLTGNLDEFSINYRNNLELLPDVGLTDYFMTPTKQQNFYNVQKKIKVIDPADNDAWTIGTPYNITWNAEILSNPIEITLWQGDTQIGIINPSVDPRPGLYNWTAGDIFGGGTFQIGAYTVKIKENGGTTEGESKDFSLI